MSCGFIEEHKNKVDCSSVCNKNETLAVYDAEIFTTLLILELPSYVITLLVAVTPRFELQLTTYGNNEWT